jgi:hypothetical protein
MRSVAWATNISRPLGRISAKLASVQGRMWLASRRTGRPREKPSSRRSSTMMEPTSSAIPAM